MTYEPLMTAVKSGVEYAPQVISGTVTLNNLPIGSNFTLSSPGSIGVYGNLSTTAGSEQWIKGGSIQIYSPLGIGSVTIVNARYDLGSFLLVAGSISSMPTISVATGSESWIKGGSIQTYNPLGSTFVLGSIYVTGSINQVSNWMISGLQYSVGISGLMSISGIVNQGTTPWIISGTANISGVFIGISGIVNQGTVNWGVSGTAFQTIVETYPVVGQDWSGAGFTAAGSVRLWSPLAGSKAQLQAFSVSTDVAQKISLYFSGTVAPANRHIWSARLPSSGGAGMNLIGITCSGLVDQAIGAVVNATSNTDITVWCRSLA